MRNFVAQGAQSSPRDDLEGWDGGGGKRQKERMYV